MESALEVKGFWVRGFRGLAFRGGGGIRVHASGCRASD